MERTQVEREFKKSVEKCKEIITACGFTLPTKIEYKLNYRFTAKFGQCKLQHSTQKYTIDIAGKYFEAYLEAGQVKEMEDTILHEMCHALPDGMTHGYGWTKYTKVINSKFGYNIQERATHDSISRSALDTAILLCDKCGRKHIITKRMKAYKNPQNYKCVCGGKLHLEK
jgi:predicted SprT family Zn-dependent metalloprotease